MENALVGADAIEGVVLRYGGFYGPGTSISRDGSHAEAIRKRAFPIIGSGRGVWSFVHIDDAVSATVAGVDRGSAGIYNVVDDEPAPVAEWLPYLASALGAKPPLRIPAWLGRLVGGEFAVALMNEVRGASNAKAKRELAWRLRFSSWREGFRQGLG